MVNLQWMKFLLPVGGLTVGNKRKVVLADLKNYRSVTLYYKTKLTLPIIILLGRKSYDIFFVLNFLQPLNGDVLRVLLGLKDTIGLRNFKVIDFVEFEVKLYTHPKMTTVQRHFVSLLKCQTFSCFEILNTSSN